MGWRYGLCVAGVYGLCAAPVLMMLVPLLLRPFDTATELVAMAGSTRLWALWGRSLGVALGTAVLATAVGGPLGILLDQPGFRTRSWPRLLLTIPLLLPPHVLAVAWVDLLGEQGLFNGLATRWGLAHHPFPLYTVWGVVLIQALSLFPIPMWCLWHVARRIDPALPEAARNLGAGRVKLAGLLLPIFVPAIIIGALAVFVLSLLSFSIPSLLQTPVFTVEIFTAFNSFLDPHQAALTALPLMLTGVATVVLALRLTRHSTMRTASNQHRNSVSGTWARFGIWTALALAGVVTILLPLSALGWRALPPATLLAAWRTGAGEIGCSVLLATLGPTLMLALALPLTWATRTRNNLVLLIPCAVAWLASGPVFGVGLIQVWNHAGPAGWVYDGVLILLLAGMGRTFLFAWLGCRLALAWVPEDRIEAARNLGANDRWTLLKMVLPLLRRPLLAVWAGLAILVMGEVETTVLVAPPGWVPVSLRIFTLMHYGPSAAVSALALLQALSTGVLLAIAGFFTSGWKFTPRT